GIDLLIPSQISTSFDSLRIEAFVCNGKMRGAEKRRSDYSFPVAIGQVFYLARAGVSPAQVHRLSRRTFSPTGDWHSLSRCPTRARQSRYTGSDEASARGPVCFSFVPFFACASCLPNPDRHNRRKLRHRDTPRLVTGRC